MAYKINSEHVILRKSQAAVNYYDAVPVFKCSDVHPDLLESAERDDTKGRRGAVPQSFCSVFQSLSSSGCSCSTISALPSYFTIPILALCPKTVSTNFVAAFLVSSSVFAVVS